MSTPLQGRGGDLAAILNDVRKDLLDFGLRNPLLNYRLLKSRGIDVVDERPVDIYRVLVTEGKQFSFLPTEERTGSQQLLSVADADGRDEDATDEVTAGDIGLEDEDQQHRYTDRYLQTGLNSTQLQTRLLSTYYAARTSIEEQGVNTLYLAMGMVRWQEADSAEETHRAPLLLVPVELERSNARERFRLKYTGEEIGGNVTLAEFLRQNFGIQLPEIPDSEDLDVYGYFRSLKKAIASQPRWAIAEGTVVLGFFSFTKFLMYRDLDPSTWPDQNGLLNHEVLNRLLGAGNMVGNGSLLTESDFVDDHLKDHRGFQVLDADSSQTLALMDVASGRNMVIQGPPGTGKSQTIVNLIAESLADGKRILFVSEKMAALEVVKRRLDSVGLGPACLELHSNKTNKKTVIEEIKRTTQIQAPQIPRMESDLAALEETRRKLNDYCHAVNTPVGKSGETPCALYGRLLPVERRLESIQAPRLELRGDLEWTDVDVHRKRVLVERLQDLVSRCGVPTRHPFWGSRLRVFLPTQREGIKQVLLQAADAVRSLDETCQQLATFLGVTRAVSRREAELALSTSLTLAAAPSLLGLDPNDTAWTAQATEIHKALDAGKRLRELHAQWDARLQPGAWSSDVSAIRADLSRVGRHWWRFLSGRWRSACKRLSDLVSSPIPKEQTGLLEITDAILEAALNRSSLSSMAPLLSRLFGEHWNGESSDWELLLAQSDWIVSTREQVSKNTIAAWCLSAPKRQVDRTVLEVHIPKLQGDLLEENRATGEVTKCLEIDVSSQSAPPIAERPLVEIQRRWLNMASRVSELDPLVAYNQSGEQCQAEQLEAVVRIADVWENAAARLTDIFDRVYISDLLDLAFRERPALANFDGPQQSQYVDRFRQLDLRLLDLNRCLVALEHTRRLPSANTGNGQIGVLWREFEKRGRFLPLRKLMAKAGNAIQAIKPVFMMSPLSIANFIPPGALEFDVIIFDEASQVRPADALGAIVRGRQVVVVGDSKQLPPTSFFEAIVAQDAEEDEEELATADIESVLGLFCSRGAHQRMLLWHYRSRHESLIAVSNHLFYGDRLVVFPSPDQEKRPLGLIYHRIDNAPYDRSRTRSNPVEAKVVAEAVMSHAREQLRKPAKERLTLGVAAFSVAQMDAILQEIELLRRQNPSCEEFFSFHPYEPFFVKNLENVQGDERDIIFISVGYGRTAEGYLAMSFGPLNRVGGERRLNVLISRARRRCEVFTTLGAEDIDLSRTNAIGLFALKTFLTYAATGKLDVPVPTRRPQDSVFEEQVLDALTRKGYTVHAQVGCAGFFLDLAVVDPSRPGSYLLGIECDGAAYHSARSARDRDRLRQAVLEGLNWRIHRIWSTDWFRNPDRELDRVVQAIEAAKQEPKRPSRPSQDLSADLPAAPISMTSTPERPLDVVPLSPSRSPNVIPKYRTATLQINLGATELHLVAPSRLVQWLAQVTAVESPIYWLEAARRVANAAGVQRLGNRIQDAFQRACRSGVRSGTVSVRGGFLWRTDMSSPPLRDRSDLPQTAKKIEYVAPEEICAAIERVTQDSYGIPSGDVAGATCRLLGFGRISDEMRTVVEKQRDVLVAAGRLMLKGECLICPDGTQTAGNQHE